MINIPSFCAQKRINEQSVNFSYCLLCLLGFIESRLYSLFELCSQGAAIAYVADLLKVPAIFIKAVTDIVDGDKPTAEEFLQNLAAVTAALDGAVEKVVDFISGKCLSEL